MSEDSPKEIATYIASSCQSLRVMAERGKMPLLVYLLGMVIMQAEKHIGTV